MGEPDIGRKRQRYFAVAAEVLVLAFGLCISHEEEHSQVSLARTFSKLNLAGIGLFSRPSLLKGLFPVRMALAYSRKSLYSGFLYQIIQSGSLNLDSFSSILADVVASVIVRPSLPSILIRVLLPSVYLDLTSYRLLSISDKCEWVEGGEPFAGGGSRPPWEVIQLYPPPPSPKQNVPVHSMASRSGRTKGLDLNLTWSIAAVCRPSAHSRTSRARAAATERTNELKWEWVGAMNRPVAFLDQSAPFLLCPA